MADHASLADRAYSPGAVPGARAGLFSDHDPRVRLAVALVGCVAAVALQSLGALASALAIALLALAASRPDLRRLRGRLLSLEGFMIMVLVTLPFTVPATAPDGILLQVGPFTASGDGLRRAFVILLKANIVVLLLAALIGGLEATQFGRALAGLGLPGRLVTLLLMTVRYMEVLQRDYARLRRSMRVRGFRARADRHSLRSVGYLIGMLLVRSFDRSERILDAMRCRGFNGTFRHDPLDAAGGRDAVLALAAAIAVVACVAVEVAVR
ncbi:MAG: cobalt ECF transporter T component CbiQ [Rhodospirillaceae bacterium]|nr:cobalt ECF transporter T component CbiQ [Rhodospirillaceae bacterium]